MENDRHPFGDHDKMDAQPDETIPLTPRGVMGRGSTWQPEQGTPF